MICLKCKNQLYSSPLLPPHPIPCQQYSNQPFEHCRLSQILFRHLSFFTSEILNHFGFFNVFIFVAIVHHCTPTNSEGPNSLSVPTIRRTVSLIIAYLHIYTRNDLMVSTFYSFREITPRILSFYLLFRKNLSLLKSEQCKQNAI